MPVEPRTAIDAFNNARYYIGRVQYEDRIGSQRVLDDIQGAVRSFGQGVEGLWNVSMYDPRSVSYTMAHEALIDLKNLSSFEGAARVAYQRSGYMDVPYEQRNVLRKAYDDAGRAIDLLRRFDYGGRPPYNNRPPYNDRPPYGDPYKPYSYAAA